MKFSDGDIVRVVSAGSNFFGWTGVVVANFDGDLMTGEKHYLVKCVDLMPPLLFREFDLAFGGEQVTNGKLSPPPRDLSDPLWAVICDNYLSMSLTHAEALMEARELRKRKQHAFVVTNETAQRLVENNIGFAVATMPDMKF